MRDVRITMIYEGTNEIQAIDLLMRKILADKGHRLGQLLDTIDATLAANADKDLSVAVTAVQKLTATLRDLTERVGQASLEHPVLPYHVASEMMRLTGHCILSWLWLKASQTATALHDNDPAFYDAKRHTADYYFTYILPETLQLAGVVETCLARAKTQGLQDFRGDLNVQ